MSQEPEKGAEKKPAYVPLADRWAEDDMAGVIISGDGEGEPIIFFPDEPAGGDGEVDQE